MGSILPRKIQRSPVLASVAEIRLSATIPSPALFASLYSKEKDAFPIAEQLPAAGFPREDFPDPNWKYLAHFKLSSQDRKKTLQIGPRVVIVSAEPYIELAMILNEFPRLLASAGEAAHGATIERIGLRYINLFEGQNVVPRTTFRAFLEQDDLLSGNFNMRAEVPIDGFTAAVMVASNATVSPGGPQFLPLSPDAPAPKQGSILDIDVSAIPNGTSFANVDSLVNMFAKAHDIAKALFFKALSDELIQELGPID